MPVPETVEQALLDAFGVAFNADALADHGDDERRRRGLDAASDLVTLLGPRARGASALLRAMTANRRHPFFGPLTSDTNFGWNGSDENFALFRRLAGIVADGVDEVVPGGRPALRPGDRLWCTIGNEFNPGDPFGRVVLTIDDQHRVTLEHHSRQGSATYTAELGAGVLDEIRRALAAGGFPHVPEHRVPAGAAIRRLELVIDGEPVSASVYDDFGRQLAGYRDAFAILDSLTLQLTGYAEHDPLKTPVSNLRRAT